MAATGSMPYLMSCPDHIIDVAVVKDIIGLSVIGAETEVVKETEILNPAHMASTFW